MRIVRYPCDGGRHAPRWVSGRTVVRARQDHEVDALVPRTFGPRRTRIAPSPREDPSPPSRWVLSLLTNKFDPVVSSCF